MKLLSVAVPCYNSQEYMKNCIDSLLEGQDLVEIIIVDDGSKDNTAAIADEYAAKYPDIVKAVHQENGGHGEAVNTGLRNATGLYFKVVDSDDWVNKEAYLAILDKLREITGGPQTLDMMISNFVYEKQGAKRKKVMRYKSYMPENKIFTWKEMGRMPVGKYILMHSVIYRTGLLRDCGLELPKHTFYVDNLFVYQPLPHVQTMYYMDVNFYRYFIGREDQSVHEDVMIRRIDQQLFGQQSQHGAPHGVVLFIADVVELLGSDGGAVPGQGPAQQIVGGHLVVLADQSKFFKGRTSLPGFHITNLCNSHI